MTDAELVARTREGDTEAFGTLVARYYNACWRYAYHMLGNSADAEDAVQESLIRAYRAIGKYDERDQFRGWLFSILTNQCRNARKMIGRYQQRFIQDDILFNQAPAPHVALSFGANDAALMDALGRLPTDQREALLLRYAEDMDYPQMSRVTGASQPALKMRVKRGTERLRALLSHLGDLRND